MTVSAAMQAELGQILKPCLMPRPADWAPEDTTGLAAAAVLVPLLVDKSGIQVILTVRAAHLRHHSGQISLPGGRREPLDPDPVATALRETEEEIGLDPQAVTVIGGLNALETGTGFLIRPVVGVTAAPFSPRAVQPEVAAVFRVPLDFLMDPANRQRRSRLHNGKIREYVEIPFLTHRIWGATAAVLLDLCERVAAVAPDLSEVKNLPREIANF